MNCKCIEELDAKLLEHNLLMACCALKFPNLKTVINLRTEWRDKSKAPRGQKNNPPSMRASHCPFCGVKLEADKEEESV